MLIPCPFCGQRESSEFQSGGESHLQRPDPAECAADEAWGNYLFHRANPKGAHAERWLHAGGCSQWFNILRDTASHKILRVYGMTEPRPDGL